MQPPCLAWKKNWTETRKHFTDWWRRRGMVVTVGGGFAAGRPHERVPNPGARPPAYGDEAYCSDPARVAACNHYALSRGAFLADKMPMADFTLGPGTLSVYLGAIPVFSDKTVWYEPCMTGADPAKYPPVRFDPENRWWKITEQTARACAELGRGKYMAACPDLIENMDTLAALRGTNEVLMDMADRPEWVEEKLAEINRAWFEVYGRIYDIIKLSDNSSAFIAYHVWGPGKTAKLQCDSSAMFSPAMFDRFIVPRLTEQCEWLDNSLYHLDGSQCLCHLDSLLGIDALDAIEWTPDPTVPKGGSPHWYGLYRRILEAGKSVQVVNCRAAEVIPLLDAIGGRGVYLCNINGLTTVEAAEKLLADIEQYR